MWWWGELSNKNSLRGIFWSEYSFNRWKLVGLARSVIASENWDWVKVGETERDKEFGKDKD